MPLAPVSIPVRFSGGVERKADPKGVMPGRLLKLENAVFGRALSLQKRKGYASLGTAVLGSATGYTDVRGLGARGDELILFCEGTSLSYVDGATAWSEIPDGVQSVIQSDRALVKTISQQTSSDIASAGGISLVAWDDSRGGIWYAAMETDGGRVTISPAQASSTGTRPRCVRSGSNLLLVWSEAALGQLRVKALDPTAPHLISVTSVLTDGLVTTLANFDACYVPGDHLLDAPGAACIVWNHTSGVRVGWLTPAGAIGSVGAGYPGPLTIAPAAAVTAGPAITTYANCGGSATSEWRIAWATAANAYAADVTSNPETPAVSVTSPAGAVALSVASINRVTLASRLTAGSIAGGDVYLEDRASPPQNSTITRVYLEQGGNSPVTGQTVRGVCLASTAWTDPPLDSDATTTSNTYVNLLHPTPLQATYLTMRHDGLIVAQSTPGNAPADPPGQQLPRVSDDGEAGRVYSWCGTYRGRLDANAALFTEDGPRLITYDFGAVGAYQTAYVGRTLYLGGAVTMVYDGLSWVEAGFHMAPDWDTGTVLHSASTAGAGGMTNGTRNYIAWYEATLANGEIVRGPTSKPYQVVVTGSDDRVSLAIPSCRVTAWGRGTRENCRVCVARTIDGDASIYYRITSLDPGTEGDPNGYVANDPSVDTVTVIDDLSDANLALQEPHYTTGGIPSNDALAVSGVIAEGKGRLFCAAASSTTTVFFSQERADGFTAEMTPELQIVVPPYGGTITGLVVMDDRLLIFKRSAVYQVIGSGPPPGLAASEGWSPPQLITSDVGCVDQRTIATTPFGVVFQSAKGIYQLDRGGQVSYVGAPVEAFNSQRITRATLIDDATQIRFLTDSGQTLLYDYLFGQWSTFTQHEGVDSAIVAGVYHYLRTDGRVFKQADTYADDNLQIPMVIETAWIRLGEARQGFQRIWHAQILGTWISAHSLRVQVKTDYDATDNWSEPVTFDASSMGGGNYGDGNYGDGNYGGDSPSIYEFTMHVGRKCESIQFRFTFPEDADDAGACAELTELLITGGVKGARNKLPAERMG